MSNRSVLRRQTKKGHQQQNMGGKPKDLSARGNQPTAGNPPAEEAAGTRNVQVPLPCTAEVVSPGQGGSSLLDSDDGMSQDRPSSIGTLTQSMESLLLERERTGKQHAATTVNPVPTTDKNTPPPKEGLSKRQLRRLRRKDSRAKAEKAKADFVQGSVPSSSTPVTAAAKRGRSDVDSSTPGASTGASCAGVANSRAATQQPMSKSKRRKVAKTGLPEQSSTDEVKGEPDPRSGLSEGAAPSGSGTATGVGGKSFAEAASQALVVVIEADNPQREMSQRHVTFVEDHIWKLLGETKESPRFEGMVFRDGTLKVQCTNEHSLKWLLTNVAKFPAFDGIKFSATKGSDMPKLVRAVVWIPGPRKAPGEILARLRNQNPGLDTKYWRIRAFSSRRKNPGDPEGSTLALGIDTESLKVLESVYGLRPHLGFGRVKFHVSGK